MWLLKGDNGCYYGSSENLHLRSPCVCSVRQIYPVLLLQSLILVFSLVFFSAFTNCSYGTASFVSEILDQIQCFYLILKGKSGYEVLTEHVVEVTIHSSVLEHIHCNLVHMINIKYRCMWHYQLFSSWTRNLAEKSKACGHITCR